MNRAANQQQKGFTLIEMMVAMAFVSVLMLTIAMAVIQIGNIYNKGLTMRAVDYAGRALSTEIRQTLGQSEPFSVDTALRIQKHPGSSSLNPDGGRLCTGTFSYIWNFGTAMDNPINKYADISEVGPDGSASDSAENRVSNEIRFIKLRDNGGGYCADLTKPILQSEAVELLSGGDHDLAIQRFEIVQIADDQSTRQALYRITMELGTNREDSVQRPSELTTMDTTCKPPSDDTSLQDFCAVNQFVFTVQAGNRGTL